MNSYLEKVIQQKFDYIIVTKSDIINPIIFKKYKNINFIYYFFDTYQEIISLSLQRHFKNINKCFVISKVLSKKLSKFFNKKIYFAPQAIDHKKWNFIRSKKDIDVLFVGSKFNNRSDIINFLIKNKINVICYGNGWANPATYNYELVKLYSRSKIILNFTRDHDTYSIRVYQVMATKNFLLSSFSKALNEQFVRNKHFDYFENSNECLSKIKYYLNNDKIREEIAENSFKKVHEEYKWSNILASMLNE